MSKGQATSLAEMFTNLTAIGLIILLIFIVFGGALNINEIINENQLERHTIALAQVLLTSDYFVYSDGEIITRAVFDKDKLDNIQKDPQELFSEINYPNHEYFIMINDLDVTKQWLMGKEFSPAKGFPVAIRYSDDDVHVGMLIVGLKEVK